METPLPHHVEVERPDAQVDDQQFSPNAERGPCRLDETASDRAGAWASTGCKHCLFCLGHHRQMYMNILLKNRKSAYRKRCATFNRWRCGKKPKIARW